MFVSFVLRYDLFQFFIATIAITPRACIQMSLVAIKEVQRKAVNIEHIGRRYSLKEFVVTQESFLQDQSLLSCKTIALKILVCTSYIQPGCQNRQQNRNQDPNTTFSEMMDTCLQKILKRIPRIGFFRFTRMESTIVLYSQIFNWTV